MKVLRCIVLFSLILAVLLGSLVAFAIHTESGRKRLADITAYFAGKEVGADVELVISETKNINNWKMSSIKISDSKGVWFEAKDIVFEWRAEKFLEGIYIDKLLVGETIYRRNPITENEGDEFEWGEIKAPPFSLHELSIGVLTVNSPYALLPQKYKVSGYFTPTVDDIASISIETLEGTSLKAQIKAGKQGDTISLSGTINEAPGGILAKYLKNPSSKPYNLIVDASAAARQDAYEIVIKRLETTFGDNSVSMVSDVSIDEDLSKIHVKQTNIKVNGGFINVKGEYEDELVDLTIEAKSFSTAILALAGWDIAPGNIEGLFELEGNIYKPTATGNVTYSGTFKNVTEEAVIRVPIQAVSVVLLKDNILKIDTDIKESKKLVGNINVEIPWKLKQLLEVEGYDYPIEAKISANTNLNVLTFLLDEGTHKLNGRLRANTNFSGTVNNPSVKGHVVLENGYYANFFSGTVLNNLNINAELLGKSIKLRKANATDDAKGTLSLTGNIDWSDKEVKPVSLKLKAAQANILRREDMDGSATGELKLEGSFRELTLSGVLDVTPFTMTMDSLLEEDIPEIEINEIFVARAGKTTPEWQAYFPKVNMDVALKAEKDAFIKGRGLDAELKGSVFVKGSLHNSEYSGSFQTVKGTYAIFGRSFALKEGKVKFEGDDISLLIPATHKSKDVEIRAELVGNIEEPSLQLSSIPAMPKEEIVSYLLFGKSSRNINPIQAIRLANAIQSLARGTESGFDPIAATKDIVGIDALSVESEEGENGQGYNVGVGKKLHDNVYIELEKGTSAEQPWKANVEAEITPNFSVESTTGTNSSIGGVEFLWKKDY